MCRSPGQAGAPKQDKCLFASSLFMSLSGDAAVSLQATVMSFRMRDSGFANFSFPFLNHGQLFTVQHHEMSIAAFMER